MGYRIAAYSVDLAKVAGTIGSKDERLYKRLLAKNKTTFEDVDALDDEDEDEDEDVEEIDLSQSGQNIGDFLQKAFSGLLSGDPQPRNLRLKAGANDPLFKHMEVKITERAAEELRGVNPDDLANKGEVDEPEDGQGETRPRSSCAEVLRHMLFGEEYDRRTGSKYGYALEAICEHFGERLDDAWAPMYKGSDWRELVRAAFKSAGIPGPLFRSIEKMTERGAPIAIPKIDDWPGIGYLKLDEIRETRGALSAVNMSAIKDTDVREGLERLLDWFRICEESNRDVICLYY